MSGNPFVLQPKRTVVKIMFLDDNTNYAASRLAMAVDTVP
jgi:hypothetical protein